MTNRVCSKHITHFPPTRTSTEASPALSTVKTNLVRHRSSNCFYIILNHRMSFPTYVATSIEDAVVGWCSLCYQDTHRIRITLPSAKQRLRRNFLSLPPNLSGFLRNHPYPVRSQFQRGNYLKRISRRTLTTRVPSLRRLRRRLQQQLPLFSFCGFDICPSVWKGEGT